MSVKSWINDLLRLAEPHVIIVVGNKSDLAEQRRVDQAGTAEQYLLICFENLTTYITFPLLYSSLSFQVGEMGHPQIPSRKLHRHHGSLW